MKNIHFLLMIFALSSCSLFSRRKAVGDAMTSGPSYISEGSVVPRVQYEELLHKYEALLQQTRKTEEKTDVAKLEEKNKPMEHAELTETVDVLAEEKGHESLEGHKEKDDDEIGSLRKAYGFLEKNNPQESLKIFQVLERSSSKQIKVRAKLGIGESLLKQNEYDLALQVFEDILQNDAYSGVVLKALEYLVLCSEKLKLEDKRKRYASLLKDVFGA